MVTGILGRGTTQHIGGSKFIVSKLIILDYIGGVPNPFCFIFIPIHALSMDEDLAPIEILLKESFAPD